MKHERGQDRVKEVEQAEEEDAVDDFVKERGLEHERGQERAADEEGEVKPVVGSKTNVYGKAAPSASDQDEKPLPKEDKKPQPQPPPMDDKKEGGSFTRLSCDLCFALSCAIYIVCDV